MKKNRSLLIGIILVTFIVLIAIAGPYFPFVDQQLKTEGLRKMNDGTLKVPAYAPSHSNILGTDKEGRDILSRLIIGTKEVLISILGITLIRFLIAVPFGLISSVNKAASRLLDFYNKMFSFVPIIFMVVLIVNLPYIMYSQHRTIIVILIIALLEVGRVGQFVQTTVLTVSKKPFIEAALSTGTNAKKMFSRHYFPFLLPELIVNILLDFGRNMFLLGQLGIINIFLAHRIESVDELQLEIINDSNAWPLLFKDVTFDVFTKPWIPFAACVFITFAIIGFNQLGKGLKVHFERNSIRYF
ncbi:ABC transporter permease subunit [Heyndrickxia sp. NPDC080065]|uniref:ABC transporter permease subunit n=1 Tax=Heyndrickxia sp. NPDC080065 TaxID=3390568 RepID=UPI003D07D565